MVPFIKEIITFSQCSSGIKTTKSNPNEIIIDEEISINYLVIGSNAKLKINY